MEQGMNIKEMVKVISRFYDLKTAYNRSFPGVGESIITELLNLRTELEQTTFRPSWVWFKKKYISEVGVLLEPVHSIRKDRSTEVIL